MNAEEMSDLALHNSYDALRLQVVQVLRSAKRTPPSTLQTGIALLALPPGVVVFLVATSQFGQISDISDIP